MPALSQCSAFPPVLFPAAAETSAEPLWGLSHFKAFSPSFKDSYRDIELFHSHSQRAKKSWLQVCEAAWLQLGIVSTTRPQLESIVLGETRQPDLEERGARSARSAHIFFLLAFNTIKVGAQKSLSFSHDCSAHCCLALMSTADCISTSAESQSVVQKDMKSVQRLLGSSCIHTSSKTTCITSLNFELELIFFLVHS